MRTGSASKSALRKLLGILAILVADNRAIPALRALDPHLRDVVEDALTSINEGLHVFDRMFDVRPPARLKGERIEIETLMPACASWLVRLVDSYRFLPHTDTD